MNKALPLSQHLKNRLRRYQIALPVGFSLAAGLAMGGLVVYYANSKSKAVLDSVAPHIALLIETNDRPELQRLMASITKQSGSAVDVVIDGVTVASTVSRSAIGLSRHSQSVRSSSFPTIDGNNLVTQVQISRPGGAASTAVMRMFSPLRSILLVVVVATLSMFLATIGVLWKMTASIAAAAEDSISPVASLDEAIRGIASGRELSLPQTGISELDNIRSAVMDTQLELKLACDALAESRAREIAGEAYRRLIHDLHTPVTALRQMMKHALNEQLTTEDRSEAQRMLVTLGEQILKQVAAGKNNLSVPINIQPNIDLVESVRTTIARAKMAVDVHQPVEIVASLPEQPILFAHDPIQIERMLFNFISNAAEASATKIEVSARATDGTPTLVISDNGPGMSEQSVSLHLQGRGASSKANRAGLGLSSCNHIARSHGMRIVHRKSPQGGAEFEVRTERRLESERGA